MKTNTPISQLFKLSKNIISFIKVACFLYAFACVFYWFIALTNLPIINSVDFLFVPIFDYIKLFYNQENFVSGIADLSGIIACIIFIVFAIIAHILYEFVDSQEEIYYINLKKQHKIKDLIVEVKAGIGKEGKLFGAISSKEIVEEYKKQFSFI